MTFRDLIVHVNVSKHCRQRLEVAAQLARTFDAHLTGLYTSAVGDVAFFMIDDVGAKAAAPTMRAWWMEMRDKVRAEFDVFWRDAGIAVDWIEVGGDVGAMVPLHARYADLTIVGQLDPEELLPRPEYEIPERVALESGQPVLVVPYAGSFASVGRRILIAWNGSPQAARAVRDALPLLKRAEKVMVLTLNPAGLGKGEETRPGDRLLAHLRRHGIEAESHELTADHISAEDFILSRAVDEGADLIVMGAYGHSRAREVVLGGATRGMFKHMTMPVLMSH